MRRWAQKLLVILATGYIFFFYSERVFWAFSRPGDKPRDFVLGWLVYSLLAWVFLLLVRHCRIVAFPAVFVAGAVFGWLAEGVVVDTLYGSSSSPFPTSISFTGLAWHALISVSVGWFWQAKVLVAGGIRNIACFAGGAGVAWALWAAWWPAELGWANTSLAAFAGHTMACSIPLVMAWAALGIAKPRWFNPVRLEFPVLLGLAGLFFLAVRVPATPRSALVLPPLLALCAYALWRNRSQEKQPDLLEEILGRIHVRSCLALFIMPTVAIAVYAPLSTWSRSLPSNWVLYAITMPLGFVCFLLSLWTLCRRKAH
jgi:hypothetical protein